MGLELNLFLIILGAGGLGYFLGMMFRLPHLFVLGCALVIGSGMLLWGFNGLTVGHYYLPDATLADITYTMSEVSMQMFALALIAVGILSALIIDFNVSLKRGASVFHY